MKKIIHFILMCCLLVISTLPVAAHINANAANRKADKNRIEYRSNCDPAVAQIDQAINNVRARLLTGGDVWWDGGDGRYVVPKVPIGQVEVSSIFAGAVWLGGVDPAGNLKLAAQAYGRNAGNADFWPGPLDPVTGGVEQEVCERWDRFFTVTGAEIDEHLRRFDESIRAGKPYDVSEIPEGVRGWPARGNQLFFDVHGFELPNTSQGLAGFFDQDGDGIYDAESGDYPIIEVRGCPDPQYPDEMIFWIYNDAGNIHSESLGDPIQMEIQVQAFSYATNDQINDMTFQRYKLINRAVESIDSMFFAMWVDPDLGCFTDDYVGCDTTRSLAFVYNADAVDGETGCNCTQGVPTYCEEIPILGVDYFRGPLDENFQEIGMSSFTYYNNPSQGSPPPGTTDPQTAQEFYNYISGSWRDGSPFTFGDDGFQDGEVLRYAFPGNPSNPNEWSMASSGTDPNLDRRTLQASGPFQLDPGAVNELIIGVVWVADQLYPAPNIRELRFADDLAQALFDNCFDIEDGPDAPDVDFVALDQEIIAIFTNDTIVSNNAFEAYSEEGLQIPEFVDDNTYEFEGYKFYQLSGPDVTLADLDDPSKARIIYQADIKNGIGRIFNWVEADAPNFETVFVPMEEVDGADRGIETTFKITEDQFAEGDRRLVNHRDYFFTALAYGYNNYEEFDPETEVGQRSPYIEGRRNIGDGANAFYTVSPRAPIYQTLNAEFGDGAQITRLDGIGAGGNFLDVSDEVRDAILDGTFDGTITYEPGRGPIDVAIYNPLEVRDGEFTLTFIDSNLEDDELETTARWELTDKATGDVVASERTIERINEQIIGEYGFSITIGQSAEPGDNADENNGRIGYEEEYADEEGVLWFTGTSDGNGFPSYDSDDLGGNIEFFNGNLFNYAATSPSEPDEIIDPEQSLTEFGDGTWIPYSIGDWRSRPTDVQFGPLGYYTPIWSNGIGGNLGSTVRSGNPLSALNNVDVVFTSDKSKWSRCVVLEMFSNYDEAFTGELSNEGRSEFFDLRDAPSVGKEDNDSDGLPDPDGDGIGMGWFPGYAIDVETGQRLNIFFGENSMFGETAIIGGESTSWQLTGGIDSTQFTGRDMMWNPTNLAFLDRNLISRINFLLGGQHFIFVTDQPYDECADLRGRLDPARPSVAKVPALRNVKWAAMPYLREGTSLLSYADGLIPNDLVVKLRVENPYRVATGTDNFNGYPTYEFKFEGVESEVVASADADPALDQIRAVPNPYYGYSSFYENSQFATNIEIQNLPAKCVVTIYSLDGKFIRQYNRDEVLGSPVGNNRGIRNNQAEPNIRWDLRNSKGIPVASGVYLIHIDGGELGERVIKWFGVARQFDPRGL